jgi:CPA2 family monovalent cation:H+ antiporter-2
MAETAKTLNPGIQVVIRTHNPQEAALLEKDDCGKVFFGEQELARAMTRYVLERLDGRETG